MSYAKAHPFGYEAKKNRKVVDHSYEPVTRIQTVPVTKTYKVPVKDAIGRIVGYDEVEAHYTRTIKHYDAKPKKGRTLAEMVYDTVIK